MIDLTPLEVRKKKGDFRRAMRGYDPALVDDFLDLVADRLEQLVRDNLALTERVARLEHQVNDNRDRERALTDALVTAQEMREEMRQQTQREAELLRRTAEQEVTQLRRTTEQEVAQLRRNAEQESSQIRAEALAAREREEEVLRRLRARQQQLLQSYRTFLSRELAELQVIGETLEIESMPRSDAATVAATPAQPAMRSAHIDIPQPAPVSMPADHTAVAMGAIEVAPLAPEDETPVEEELFVTVGIDDEPFAPEPVDDWEEEPAAIAQVELAPEEEIIVQDELLFVDDATDDVADGNTDALNDDDAFDVELDEEIGAPDHDATVLLENALRAGYRLDLEDQDGEELLLEETTNGDPPADWLDRMIDDDEQERSV